MDSFKDFAYQILKEAGKPLHSKKITKIALARGLKTTGKTPAATMNADLIVDINTKKEKSRFVKAGPSVFGLNESLVNFAKEATEKSKKSYRISKNISTKQKGDIAEARIAELITLYGDTTLSCYKPISDDEGIDLIVKEKGSLKMMYIQIKSRFGTNANKIFSVVAKAATAKKSGVIDNYSMAVVFCFFDTEEGDIWDHLWFIPAPEFNKHANKLQGGDMLGFVAGRKKKESNKWDDYLINKKELANQIIAQLQKI